MVLLEKAGMMGDAISPNAVIGTGNSFGPGVVVGDDVVIGDNNTFGAYAVIAGKTEIGDGNYIGDHTSIGRIPTNSHHKYEFVDGPESNERFGKISIGNGNVIRELINIGLPTQDVTFIGNECYIMPHCHIAHDVHLEDRVILSNHCSPGGHTRILRGANLGKGVQVHQRSVIGQYAMIGVGSVVIRNVLPAATIAGNPARFLRVNTVGLERNGFSNEDLEAFVNLLSDPDEVDMTASAGTPAVQEVVQHFMDVLSTYARDARTVPAMRSAVTPSLN